MSYRFENPVPQFFNGNGLAYVNGTLNFYEPGTLDPKDTYSDEGLTSPNVNPIELNSLGASTTEIWMDGKYRVIAKTQAGATIWDRDPVTGLGGGGEGQPFGSVESAAALRALAKPDERVSMATAGFADDGDGGGGLWAFDPLATADDNIGTVVNPTGNGGAGRWLRVYHGPVNPKWFGAAEDGVTDDTDVFEAIIDAGFIELRLNALKSYLITRTLELPTGFSLSGPDFGWLNVESKKPRLVFLPSGSDTVCIRNATGALGHCIQNLVIDIDSVDHSGIALTASPAYSGAFISKVSFAGTMNVGIWMAATHSNTLEDLSFTAVTVKRACIYFGLCNTTTVRRLYTSLTVADVAVACTGISLASGAGNVFEDCVLQGMTVGVWLNIPSDTIIRNPYSENTICTLSIGSPTGGSQCTGTSVYGGHFRHPFASHPQYASRGPIIFISQANQTSFYSPHMVSGSVTDAAMAGWVCKTSVSPQSVSISAPRFFNSDLRTEFMRTTLAGNPSLTATGVPYGTQNAQEIILKSDGAFGAVSHGIRVDNTGAITATAFTPSVFGASVSALLDAAFPTIASV